MVLTYFFAGWFYIYYYGPDKNVIKGSSYFWGHSIFTEVKEHWFFFYVLASLLLPFIVFTEDLVNNRTARKFALTSALMIFVVGLLMEGMGAIITMTLRLAHGY